MNCCLMEIYVLWERKKSSMTSIWVWTTERRWSLLQFGIMLILTMHKDIQWHRISIFLTHLPQPPPLELILFRQTLNSLVWTKPALLPWGSSSHLFCVKLWVSLGSNYFFTIYPKGRSSSQTESIAFANMNPSTFLCYGNQVHIPDLDRTAHGLLLCGTLLPLGFLVAFSDGLRSVSTEQNYCEVLRPPLESEN